MHVLWQMFALFAWLARTPVLCKQKLLWTIFNATKGAVTRKLLNWTAACKKSFNSNVQNTLLKSLIKYMCTDHVVFVSKNNGCIHFLAFKAGKILHWSYWKVFILCQNFKSNKGNNCGSYEMCPIFFTLKVDNNQTVLDPLNISFKCCHPLSCVQFMPAGSSGSVALL